MSRANASVTVSERDISAVSPTDPPLQYRSVNELAQSSWEEGTRPTTPSESTNVPPQFTSASIATIAQLAKRRERTSYVVTPLAEWQGHVTKVEEGHFYATLDGVYGEGVQGQVHDAMIPLVEVSPEDLEFVRAGAYFRLSVAYSISRGGTGTSTRTSTIVFRRLPAYQDADLENAVDISRELTGGLRLE